MNDSIIKDFRTIINRGFLSFKISTNISANGYLFVDHKHNEEFEKKFEKIREKLNIVKSSLDGIGEKQLRDTVSMLDYNGLITDIKSLGTQNVTNAWLKIYEILSHFEIRETGSGSTKSDHPVMEEHINVFCNAELPGAFIDAINFYFNTRSIEVNWRASSLLSENSEDYLGDNLGMYERYPGNWLMSEDMNGDMKIRANVEELASRVFEIFRNSSPQDVCEDSSIFGTIDIYTADGAVCTNKDFDLQEEANAQLLLGELICGFMTLKEGGTMIVKTFTFTTPYVLALINLCCSIFDEFYITKPSTSRPSNSEVYLVGLGYHPISKNITKFLLSSLHEFDINHPIFNPYFAENRNTLFSLYICTKIIHKRQQTAAINCIVNFMNSEDINHEEAKLRIMRISKATRHQWLSRCSIEIPHTNTAAVATN